MAGGFLVVVAIVQELIIAALNNKKNRYMYSGNTHAIRAPTATEYRLAQNASPFTRLEVLTLVGCKLRLLIVTGGPVRAGPHCGRLCIQEHQWRHDREYL